MQHFVCRYTQYGKISPKIDVYAFGVVLFELISGKEAVGLVASVVFSALPLLTIYECSSIIYPIWEFTQILSNDMMQFRNVLSRPDAGEYLHKLVDPRLGDDYPFDSVCKVISLSQ